MLSVVNSLAYFGLLTWSAAAAQVWTCRQTGFAPIPAIRGMFFELRPFFWPLLAARAATDAALHLVTLPDYLLYLILACTWLLTRCIEDDNDRWRGRWRRLAEQVQRVGYRLVVTPATIPG